MTINVNTPTPEVTKMCQLFDIVDDVSQCTLRMRECGEKHLPKFPLEDAGTYAFRIKTSVLLPVYSETVKNLVGKIFAKPVTLKETVHQKIIDALPSIDAEDRSFNTLAIEATRMAVHYGLAYLLVDTAPASGDTLAESKANPYITLISPRNILGWKKDSAGNLTQVRIAGALEEDDGDYGTKIVNTVTVLYQDRWEKYKDSSSTTGAKDSTTIFTLYAEGTFTLGKIPLVPIYGNRTGFMTAEPPLLELAHLNIKHWQEYSDQSNILHVARVPLLVTIGAQDSKDTEEISSQKMFSLPEDADMKYVEHSGAAIDAGQKALDDLVKLMRLCGARMTYVEQSSKTVAQAKEDASDNKSALAVIAENVRDALNISLGFMAEWLGMDSVDEVITLALNDSKNKKYNTIHERVEGKLKISVSFDLPTGLWFTIKPAN